MHNSWYANLPAMKRGARDRNRLAVHPDDLRARGLEDGARVRLWNEHGAVEVEVQADDGLLPGVVALTHGWGNQRTPGHARRAANAGRERERAAADRSGQLRATVESGVHDGRAGGDGTALSEPQMGADAASDRPRLAMRPEGLTGRLFGIVMERLNAAAHREALGLLDPTPDAAVALHCFQFWPDPARCARELLRVLVPGGRLVLILRMHRPGRAPAWLPNPIRRSADEPAGARRGLADAGFEIDPVGPAHAIRAHKPAC